MYFLGLAIVILLSFFIYKLFQQQKEIHVLAQKAALAGTGYASYVDEWSPIVPQLHCHWTNPTKGIGGSAILLESSDGIFYILTNAHLVQDDNGKMANSCDIIFPDKANTTFSVNRSEIKVGAADVDGALLKLPTDIFLKSLMAKNQRKICDSDPDIGDEIVVIGYPGIGSQDSFTVTEGIISGYEGEALDKDNDYITSAKIDSGNSGGAAVDIKNDCYIGMPTFTIDGDSASLARIRTWGSLFTVYPSMLVNSII